MKKIVYLGPDHVEYQDAPEPAAGSGNALIRVAFAGICGSDMIIYQGVHPRAKPPLVPGHEFSGNLLSGHPTITAGTPVTVFPLLSCGQCLACTSGNPHVCESLRLIGIDTDGGMTEVASVPADSIVALPPDMDLKAGAFIEPLAVGIHAVHRSGFKAGDRVIVYGAGPIGFSVAIRLRYSGAGSIVLLETNAARRDMAKQLGFHCIDSSAVKNAKELKESIKELTGNDRTDIVFDCAAHPSVHSFALDLLRVHGTMVVVGSYKSPAPVDLLKVEFKELTLIGTRVYRRDDFAEAITMLQSGRIAIDPLLRVNDPVHAATVFRSQLKGTTDIKSLFYMGGQAQAHL